MTKPGFRKTLWAALLAGALAPMPGKALEEWPTYGHDYGDTRFSPLAQITPANVASLKVAWTYHMLADAPAPTGGRGPRAIASQRFSNTVVVPPPAPG